MKHFLTFVLVCFLLFTGLPGKSTEDLNAFLAVFSAGDLAHNWTAYPKYQRDLIFIPQTWWELDRDLQLVKEMSGNQSIILDFTVHGNESGLFLSGDSTTFPGERASFGFLLNHICKILEGRRVLILVESCYAGRAYKNTVRGATRITPYDCIEDFPIVPKFAIYGSGDSFPNVGQIMYLQLKYGFRKWWIDLADYDSLGKNRMLLPKESATIVIPHMKGKWEPTTAEMYGILEKFRESIP